MKSFFKFLIFLLALQSFNPVYAQDSEYSFIVRKDDVLSRFFAILGIDKLVLFELLKAHPLNKKLNKLKPKQLISITLDEKLDFKSVHYQISTKSSLIISYKNNKFVTYYKPNKSKNKNTQPWKKVVVNIRNSFFYDGDKAGLSNSILIQVLGLFSGAINFSKELIKGDKFILVMKNKTLLSAHYINRNRRLDAYLYKGEYYDQNGYKVGKMFSSPLKSYKRISSKFSKRRFHPILKKYKSHKGIDYAADTGSPIYAARDGIVRFSRVMNGFGKAVYINHDLKYTTVYAHMSKIHPKVKEGKPIKRGDIVGYVGQTGWATGPHLHFETRIYNIAKNPKKLIGSSFKDSNPKFFKKFQSKVNQLNSFIATR